MLGSFKSGIYGKKGPIRDFQVLNLGIMETCEWGILHMMGSFSLPCDLSWPPLGSSGQNRWGGRHALRGYPVNDVASSDRIYHPTRRKLRLMV